jgi:betaine-aldehyde dehydrogenase
MLASCKVRSIQKEVQMTSTTNGINSKLARNWINGSWSDDGEISESINPSDGQVIGRFVAAGAAAASAALTAARTAFDTTNWSHNLQLRAAALEELASRVEARAQDIALMLSREGGKLLPQTMWEVGGSVAWLCYSAASARMQNGGRAMETSPGTFFHSHPEAMGVVGVISPWNSPIILSVRAIGPALAAGCTVVVKLPGQTALTNALFSEAVAATTALPPGVLNIFTETANVGAPLMVESHDVDAISFTGSTSVGRHIAAAGAKTLKRVSLELGGKTPLILFNDADLNTAIPTVMQALVVMNGQFCVTGSRVLVQRDIADTVRTALIGAYGTIRLGTSEDPEAQLGPLIDTKSVERVNAIVEEAAAYGKILVRGGPVTDGPLASGAFYRPSLVEVGSLDTFIVQNEVFGPVQTFEIFDDEKDAIKRANATEFGLAASIFTKDDGRARRVGRAIRAGLIWTNCWGILSEQFEESGYKQSGPGLLCGPRAIEEFQEIKVYATTIAAE